MDARTLKRPLTPYEQAVFMLVGSTSDELNTLAHYLAAFASDAVEPEIPASLQDRILPSVNSMRKAARDANTTVTLANLAEAALATRRGGVDPVLIEHLRSGAARAPDGSNAMSFLLAVIDGATLPRIPDALDDEQRQTLLDVALRALCEPLTLNDLSSAALATRWYGKSLDDDVRSAIDGLLASDEPFRAIGQFLTSLADRHLWPNVPADVPRRTLTLLASARHQASEFAHSVVAIGRRQGTSSDEN
jgi:hypothetical protein